MTTADLIDTRRENVRRLMREAGGPTALATQLGYANGSYIAQVAGPNPHKPITEKVAREWEAKLGIPAGWLDRQPDWDREFAERLLELVALIAEQAAAAGVKLTQRQMTRMAQLVHEHGRKAGRIDRDYIARLIELLAGK
jgi:hypothetical protein